MKSAHKIPAKSLFLLFQDTVVKTVIGRRGIHSGREKVLITRPDGIGDLILFTDALKGLRGLFPPGTHEITLIVSDQVADLAPAIGGADRVLAVNRSLMMTNPGYRWTFLSGIRREGFDLALNPVYSRVTMLEDAIVRVSGAPVRVAWRGNLDNTTACARRLADRWYTELFDGGDAPLMELQRNAAFVRELGRPDFTPAFPRVEAPEDWLSSSDELLAASGITGPYGILVPGTGSPPERAWPPERYGELALRLLDRGLNHVVIVGGQADRALARRVMQYAGSENVLDLAGKTPLGVLAGCMKRSRFVIGSDTGAVHLAGALGVPAACILGGAFPGRFFPYRTEVVAAGGCGTSTEMKQEEKGVPVVVASPEDCHCAHWDCTSAKWKGGTFPCIAAISVEAVLQGLASIPGLEGRTGGEG